MENKSNHVDGSGTGRDIIITETEGDVIDIRLSPEKTPVAYERKVRCLMLSGMTEEEAKIEASCTPIQMELFYDIGIGLFMVESEAVDNCEIYNPFSGEEIQKETDN